MTRRLDPVEIGKPQQRPHSTGRRQPDSSLRERGKPKPGLVETAAREHLPDWAGIQEAASVEHRECIGMFDDELKIVRNEHDGDPFLSEALELSEQLGGGLGVLTVRRLIETDDPVPGQQGRPGRESSLLAAGQAARMTVAVRLEPESSEQIIDERRTVLGSEGWICGGMEFLRNGRLNKLVVRVLEDETDWRAPAGHAHRSPLDMDRAGRGTDQPGDRAQQRRLAGAGRPDDGEHRARRDLDVDTLENPRTGTGCVDREATDRYHGLGGERGPGRGGQGRSRQPPTRHRSPSEPVSELPHGERLRVEPEPAGPEPGRGEAGEREPDPCVAEHLLGLDERCARVGVDDRVPFTIKHDDPVGELEHIVDAVLDDDDRPLFRAGQIRECSIELPSRSRREIRRRLVQDERPRSGRECTGEGKTLLLAPGEGASITIAQLPEPERTERLLRTVLDPRGRQTTVFEREADLVEHSLGDDLRGGILEHEEHTGGGFMQRSAADLRSLSPDSTVDTSSHEMGDEPIQSEGERRFTTPARAQEQDRFTRPHFKTRGGRAIGHSRSTDGDTLTGEDRLGRDGTRLQRLIATRQGFHGGSS